MRVVDLARAFYIIYTTDDDLITYIYIYKTSQSYEELLFCDKL